MVTFHERLRQLYDEERKNGVGRMEFATRCEVTKGQLSGWLNGKSEPNTTDLKKLARKFRCIFILVSWGKRDKNFCDQTLRRSLCYLVERAFRDFNALFKISKERK